MTMANEAMMKQWRDLKAKHPDALLLFRCGDFYETYGEDAKVCARELGITLTYGNNDKNREWPMAGFPHHALDTYLPKLIRAGKRVAICDQLDDPRLRKTVKRGVTETINNELNELNELNNMAQNNVKADLTVGTVIEIAGTTSKYIIKAIDADKLTVDFYRKEGEAPTTMPMPKAMLDKMMAAGKWKVAGETKAEEPNAAEDVQEVEDVQPEPAKTIKMEQPAKPKVTLRRKQSQPKAEKKPEPKSEKVTPKLTYTTYKNGEKVQGRIVGFDATDAAYQKDVATLLHGSAYPVNGKLCLSFSKKYTPWAKTLCDALNEGKTIDECKAMLADYEAGRDQARAESKAKREAWKERKASGETTKAETKGYSDADVAEMLKRIMAGGDIPEAVKKAMAA